MQAAVRLFRTYTIPQEWLLFTRLTIGLLIGYVAFGIVFAGLIDPYLKGLSTLQHFLIHYTIGIFFGYLIAFGFYSYKRREANLPFILSVSLLWSHLPDLMFLVHQAPHPDWMAVFFLHTLVDNTFNSFYFFSAGVILIMVLYKKIVSNG